MKLFFQAKLKGKNEVPPVDSDAFGVAKFMTNESRTKIKFFLEVKNIRDFVQAHIHFGEKDENGPVLAFLFGNDVATLSEQEGISTCEGVVMGVIEDKDILENPTKVDSVRKLIKAMKAGKTYVNVHTEQNPSGEIRGQIKRAYPDW